VDGLNANHQRALLSAFAHVNALLTEAEQLVTGEGSPVPKIVPDLTPVERQVFQDYVARLRGQLTEALKVLGIPVPQPTVRASWAIRTLLSSAEITLEDTQPGRLRGYGPLASEMAPVIERLEADLARTLRRMGAYLAGRSGMDLAGRIARLDATPVDRGLLVTLERIIRERGFIEFRSAVEALLESLESETYEIAVFGRVSSGKSSLLNTVLGMTVLPVGVTPVTAVPTRVRYGDRPRAVIQFAERPEEIVEIEYLATFVSEAGNPQNRKAVSRAVVEVPSPVLHAGIALVDTPGVSSLALAGARQTYAYLPRCDLGVLVVDGGSSPAREDLEILRLLHDSGIPALVVLSKADLLSPADRSRVQAYLKEQIRSALGLDLPVDLVSAVGETSHLGQEWFAREIAPRCRDGREQAHASARRKLAALREGVVASLRTMLDASHVENEDSDAGALVEALVREAEGALGEARRRCAEITERMPAVGASAVQEAARTVTGLVAESGRPPSAAGASVASVLRSASQQVRSELREQCLSLQDILRTILSRMATAVPAVRVHPGDLAIDLVTQPALDIPRNLDALALNWPRWVAWLPSRLERRILAQIKAQTGADVARAFSSLGVALRSWGQATLARLGEQFAAQAEPLRALVRRQGGGGPPVDIEALRADLRALSEPSPPAGP